MSAQNSIQNRSAFELKSASLPVVAILLKMADANEIAQALQTRFADEPDFFDNDAVILDLSLIHDQEQVPEFPVLIKALRALRTNPIAVRNANQLQAEAALTAGLAIAPNAATHRPVVHDNRTMQEPVVEIREVIREVEVIREAKATETVVVEKPLRSGQQIYARGADLIVLAAVNFGAEVLADGNVHVYAPLRGRAIAGASGNNKARIFTTCMEAQLVAINGIYRTGENELPADISGKPAQILLDGESLLVQALNLS